MKKLTLKQNSARLQPKDQAGFIPMLLAILSVVAFIIFLVYLRVMHVQK